MFLNVISAFRELEASPRFRSAILLSFHNARIPRQEPATFQRCAQRRFESDERLRNAVTNRASLAGQTAALDRAHDVVLLIPISCLERLVKQHAQYGACEIHLDIATVYINASAAWFNPHAGNGVFPLACCIGPALGVDARRHLGRYGFRCASCDRNGYAAGLRCGRLGRRAKVR